MHHENITRIFNKKVIVQERGEIGYESGSITWKFSDFQVIHPFSASVSLFVNGNKNSISLIELSRGLYELR